MPVAQRLARLKRKQCPAGFVQRPFRAAVELRRDFGICGKAVIRTPALKRCRRARMAEQLGVEGFDHSEKLDAGQKAIPPAQGTQPRCP